MSGVSHLLGCYQKVRGLFMAINRWPTPHSAKCCCFGRAGFGNPPAARPPAPRYGKRIVREGICSGKPSFSFPDCIFSVSRCWRSGRGGIVSAFSLRGGIRIFGVFGCPMGLFWASLVGPPTSFELCWLCIRRSLPVAQSQAQTKATGGCPEGPPLAPHMFAYCGAAGVGHLLAATFRAP